MPGLNLRGSAGINASSGNAAIGESPQSSSTVSQSAWGSAAGSPDISAGACLSPTSGFGMAFWLEVGAVLWLVAVYHAAPRRGGER